MGEYLGILKNKKNATEACSAFFCYAVAIRAKYLQLVLLYYRSISSDLHIAIHTIQNFPPQLQPWPKKSSAGDSWVQLWCLADGKEVTMLTRQSMSFWTKLSVSVYSNQAGLWHWPSTEHWCKGFTTTPASNGWLHTSPRSSRRFASNGFKFCSYEIPYHCVETVWRKKKQLILEIWKRSL